MTFMDRIYEDISPERYRVLRSRFDQFIENLDKVNVPPVKVYDALSKRQLDQLEIIRDISMVLQQKKDEDVLKAKQAAEEASKAEAEAEAEKKEGSEETVEEKQGDVTEVTEKKELNEEQQKETVQSLYKA